eukprot:3472315-Pleurochrysis_carterae.AAC.8
MAEAEMVGVADDCADDAGCGCCDAASCCAAGGCCTAGGCCATAGCCTTACCCLATRRLGVLLSARGQPRSRLRCRRRRRRRVAQPIVPFAARTARTARATQSPSALTAFRTVPDLSAACNPVCALCTPETAHASRHPRACSCTCGLRRAHAPRSLQAPRSHKAPSSPCAPRRAVATHVGRADARLAAAAQEPDRPELLLRLRPLLQPHPTRALVERPEAE